MRRYFFLLTAVCALLMALFHIADRNHAFSDHSFSWWVLPLAFYAISLPGHLLMARSMRGREDQFMIFFLLSVTVKMFLYLGLLLIWFVISAQQFTTSFIAAFAILYIVITAIDLYTLLSYRNKQG